MSTLLPVGAVPWRGSNNEVWGGLGQEMAALDWLRRLLGIGPYVGSDPPRRRRLPLGYGVRSKRQAYRHGLDTTMTAREAAFLRQHDAEIQALERRAGQES